MASGKEIAKWFGDKFAGELFKGFLRWAGSALAGTAVWKVLFQIGATMMPALYGGLIAAAFVWLALAFYSGHKEIRLALSELRHDGAKNVHDSVGERTGTIKTTTGDMKIGAVGVFHSLSIAPAHMDPPQLPQYLMCFNCRVDFHALAGVEFSPAELRITSPGGKKEICRLCALWVPSPNCPLEVHYTGKCHQSDIPWVVSHTPDERQIGNDVPARYVYLLADLEIRLLDGEGRRTHERSNVKLAFELAGSDGQPFTFRLGPTQPSSSAIPEMATIRL